MSKAEKAPAASDGPGFVDDYLLYLLARASHQVSRQFHRQVKTAGLSVPEWRVLVTLNDGDGRTVGELAAFTLLEQPTLTKVLNRMARDGLITREADAADARRVRIYSTAAGRARVAGPMQAAKAHERQVLKGYGADEARALKDALKTLIARSG